MVTHFKHESGHLHSIPAAATAAAANSFQLCPTLATHRQQTTRLPILGILQARTLEWVAISFSNA